MNHWLLWPPVAFLLILVVAMILLRGLSIFSIPAKGGAVGGKRKAYACGEDVKDSRVQPEYSQFFPFAFFFTIMHVFALIVATVPAGNISAMAMALCYTVGSVIGLFILFRE